MRTTSLPMYSLAGQGREAATPVMGTFLRFILSNIGREWKGFTGSCEKMCEKMALKPLEFLIRINYNKGVKRKNHLIQEVGP